MNSEVFQDDVFNNLKNDHNCSFKICKFNAARKKFQESLCLDKPELVKTNLHDTYFRK